MPAGCRRQSTAVTRCVIIKAAAEITKEVTGPVNRSSKREAHGSAASVIHCIGEGQRAKEANLESTALRGELSSGLLGLTFQSHDVGGFVQSPPRDHYRRAVELKYSLMP